MMRLPASLKLETLPPDFARYIQGHTEELTAAEHERTFALIRPYLKPGVMLDWGCFAGFDAWRMRQEHGSQATLHGCDVHPPLFPDFWKEIGMEYQTIQHPYKLPYADNMFDTVLGAGTLEHVPDESASLRELWRVLKPHGRLILCYLPQKYSFIEAVLRWRGEPHHKRRYTRPMIYRKLIDHGFIPQFIRRHGSTPMRGPKPVRKLFFAMVEMLERPPTGFLMQNLLAVSTKIHGIGGEFFSNKMNLYGQDW